MLSCDRRSTAPREPHLRFARAPGWARDLIQRRAREWRRQRPIAAREINMQGLCWYKRANQVGAWASPAVGSWVWKWGVCAGLCWEFGKLSHRAKSSISWSFKCFTHRSHSFFPHLFPKWFFFQLRIPKLMLSEIWKNGGEKMSIGYINSAKIISVHKPHNLNDTDCEWMRRNEEGTVLAVRTGNRKRYFII